MKDKAIEFEGVKIFCIEDGEKEYYAAKNSLDAYKEFFNNIGDDYIDEGRTITAVTKDFDVADEESKKILKASDILKDGVQEGLELPFSIAGTVY